MNAGRTLPILFLTGFVFGAPVVGDAIAKPPSVEKSYDFQMNFVSSLPLSEGVAEISAFDPVSGKLFIVDGSGILKVVDISDPSAPVELPGEAIDVSGDLWAHTGMPAGAANSVAINRGVLAVAVAADPHTNPGFVAFYNTNGAFMTYCQVGALPDMVTYTPGGTTLLVANEGEPDEGIDPVGSISVIDMQSVLRRGFCDNGRDVRTAGFDSFNKHREKLVAKGVRLFPGVSVAQDVEPEYIAVSKDGLWAWASLQENNSMALIDIYNAKIRKILPLGLKNHKKPWNKLDASDKDGEIRIHRWPVFGMYMPDAIGSIPYNGMTYIISANEGDDRGEDERVEDLTLDPMYFANPSKLQKEKNLGRLSVSAIDGDPDHDGEYEWLQSYGARSFTIWNGKGKKVFDSGDFIGDLTAAEYPALFNADDGDPAEFDTRSDNKGAEPEGVVVGHYGDHTLAFVGLERGPGGVIGLDVTNPMQPTWFDYVRRDADISPEGLLFIGMGESPVSHPLLVVSNEVSGTLTIYKIVMGSYDD